MKPAYARLCFAYLGAVVLRRGTVGLGDFTEASLDDPDLHALAERIVVEVDGNPDPAAFVPAVATASLSDGRTVEIAVTRQYGSPEWPLDRAAHFAKARACLAFGGLPSGRRPARFDLRQFRDGCGRGGGAEARVWLKPRAAPSTAIRFPGEGRGPDREATV